jgi:integrase/recombinase XerC
MTSLRTAAEAFLANVHRSQPHATWKNYRSDLLGRTGFLSNLAPGVKPSADISALAEELGAQFLQNLLDSGAGFSTRQRRASSLREFYRFAIDEYNLSINIDRLNHRIKSRHLLSGKQSAIKFPEQKIQKILSFSLKLEPRPDQLRLMRDLAFLWTLAETGLRVSEACALKIGQIDTHYQASIIGKGNKAGTIVFGKNSRAMISAYLHCRAGLDASTGFTRELLPLFARHDLTSGSKIKPIGPKAGEEIIHNLAHMALGTDYDPEITCHKLRHYFVTKILRKKGIKVAKEAARHSNINITDRYSHLAIEETANALKEVFG